MAAGIKRLGHALAREIDRKLWRDWWSPSASSGGPSGSTFLLEDGASRILLEDGTYLLMEG